MFSRSLWSRLALPFGIAVLGLILNLIVAIKMAPTFDEQSHIAYGSAILRGAPDRATSWFDSKMPVSAANAIPHRAGEALETRGTHPKLAERLKDTRTARWATVAAAFGLCLLVFLYAEALYGRVAGLFAELLFVLSPNIMAHSTMATTDLYAAFAFVLFLYALRRFLLSPVPRNAVLAAAALAFAQLTKFVALYLYPALLLILVVPLLFRKSRVSNSGRVPARSIVWLLGAHAGFFLLFVNAAFLFDRTLTPLAKYHFRSSAFQAMQQVPVLRSVPIPVPYPYMQGFDWMSYHNATGLGFGNLMLLGDVHGRTLARSDGFPLYYLVCYAVKEPLGMQFLLLAAIAWLLRHRRLSDFFAAEFPILITAGLLILALSLFSKTQIGIRHILPALALFVVLSGAAFAGWAGFGTPRKLTLGACLLYVAISVGSYFPQMIPYFNETMPDRKMAYRVLADSNLDWGQDSWSAEAFLKRNPDVLLNPEAPVAGRVLVNANLAAGVKPENADYWIRRLQLSPVMQVGYGHLLFTVPPELIGGLRVTPAEMRRY